MQFAVFKYNSKTNKNVPLFFSGSWLSGQMFYSKSCVQNAHSNPGPPVPNSAWCCGQHYFFISLTSPAL